MCKGMYMYTEKTCRKLTASEKLLCNGTVKVQLIQNIGAAAHNYLKTMIEQVQAANNGTKLENNSSRQNKKGILIFGTGWGIEQYCKT